MDQVLKNDSIEQFPKYEKEDTGKDVLDGKLDEDKNVKVCKIGKKDDKVEYCLASDACDDDKKKDFIDAHTILYYVNKDDPRGDAPKDPEKDPQFENWEKGIEKYFEKENKDMVLGKPPEDECEESDFD